jgi:microcystin degradation protein MlrC
VVGAPRIALGGFAIECNRGAEPAGRQDFEAGHWYEGPALMDALRMRPPALVGEALGFVETMDAAGPWVPLPLLDVASHPKGLVDHALFAEIRDSLLARLSAQRAEGGLDGVLLVLHGAAITLEEADAEGALLEAVRALIGPWVPLVATLDLHANVSPRMLRAADALVVYRSNPHIDMHERGAEAARFMQRMLHEPGWRPARALLRLAVLAPTITMRTAAGSGPFADMAAASAQAQAQGEVLSAAVLGSFPHSDTPDIGLAVLVHAESVAQAEAVAERVAAIGWAARAAFDPPLLAPPEALARCQGPGRWIVADLGDNPGGGAPANDWGLLRMLRGQGRRPVLAGLIHDPALAAAAHALGRGAALMLPALGHAASRVLALSDGRCTGRRGLLAGASIQLGATAALVADGLTVVATTQRFSPNDPICFEHLGLVLADFELIVLKSRGHFRAGFDEYTDDAHVVEAATPGVTSPDLRAVRWQQRPRPLWPLDARFDPAGAGQGVHAQRFTEPGSCR